MYPSLQGSVPFPSPHLTKGHPDGAALEHDS
jgi:hypothetical protein